jgi:hypothetical protein
MHKLLGHSAARIEVLLLTRDSVAGAPASVTELMQDQVHQWWMQKRARSGGQLLRRLRAPTDPDDDDDAKTFRR